MTRLDWKVYDLLVSRLAIDMREAQYRPDIIIGLAPDGLIPAQDLAEQLDVARLGVIEVTRGETGRPEVLSHPTFTHPDDHPWRALIVAGTLRDNAIMRAANYWVTSYMALSARTAALVCHLDSPLERPELDYVGERQTVKRLQLPMAA